MNFRLMPAMVFIMVGCLGFGKSGPAHWKLVKAIPFPDGQYFDCAVVDGNFNGYGALGYSEFYSLEMEGSNSKWLRGIKPAHRMILNISDTETGPYRYNFDIIDNNTVFAVINNSCVLKSGDHGSNWINTGYCGGDRVYSPRYISCFDARNVVLANEDQLFISRNGGVNWDSVSIPPEIRLIYGVFQLSPGVIYVLEAAGALYKTADAGTNWTSTRLPFQERLVYNSNLKNKVNISIFPMGAVRFKDNDHGAVVVYFQKPERAWVVFETADGGKTWNESTIYNSPGTVYFSRKDASISICDKIDGMVYLFRPADSQME